MIHFFYSPPGEISRYGCWVAVHECWMYLDDTLAGVAKVAYKNWKSDRFLVG